METAVKTHASQAHKAVSNIATGGKSMPAVPVLQQKPTEQEEKPQMMAPSVDVPLTRFAAQAAPMSPDDNTKNTPFALQKKDAGTTSRAETLARFNPMQKKESNTGMPNNLNASAQQRDYTIDTISLATQKVNCGQVYQLVALVENSEELKLIDEILSCERSKKISYFIGVTLPGSKPKTEPNINSFLNDAKQKKHIDNGIYQILVNNHAELNQNSIELQQHLDERGKQAFDFAREKLGDPINDSNWVNRKKEEKKAEIKKPKKSDGEKKEEKDNDDETAEEKERKIAEADKAEDQAGQLHVKLKEKMEINDSDIDAKDESKRLTWVLKSAALGSAIGAGVCNNFAALTALILKFSGIDCVQVMTSESHNWARYSKKGDNTKITVDPWAEEKYVPKKDVGAGTETVNLEKYPAEYLWKEYTNYYGLALQMRNELISEFEGSGNQMEEYRKAGYLDRAWMKFSINKEGTVLLQSHGLYFLAK